MFLRTVLGAVAALLVCTGSAHASSLVYVKDSNVWLANPDGTGARQLTTDGFKELPYASPSQADDVYWIGTWSTWFDYGTSTTWTDPQDAVIWQDADTGAQLGSTMFYEKPSWLQDSRHALLSQPGNRLAAQIVGSAVGANHNDVTPSSPTATPSPPVSTTPRTSETPSSRPPATSS